MPYVINGSKGPYLQGLLSGNVQAKFQDLLYSNLYFE